MENIGNLLLIVSLFILLSGIHAVTPSGELKIRLNSNVLYVAPGTFGSSLSEETQTTYRKLVVPALAADGCDPEVPILPKNAQFYLLVSRGNCSFDTKAIAAESQGAKGIVVYNSLEGIYQGKGVASESDYNCDNGYGYVNNTVEPIYGDEMQELMPSSCTKNSNCDSGRCLVTNTTDENGIKVCCAWDLYITMGSSSDESSSVNIPVVFVRMQDADTLFGYPELAKSVLDVALYSRSTSSIDLASVVVWLIAVVTVVLGSARAAEEDRVLHHLYKFDARGMVSSNVDGDDDEESGSERSSSSRSNSMSSFTSASTNAREQSASAIRSAHMQSTPVRAPDPVTGCGASSQTSSSTSSTSSFTTSSPAHQREQANLPRGAGLGRGPRGSTSFSYSPLRASHGTGSISSGRGAVQENEGNGISVANRVEEGDEGLGVISGRHSMGINNNRGSASSRSDDDANGVNDTSLDITFCQAVGFVFVSSGFLLLLYFVDVYSFVGLMYLVAAAVATTLVLFNPFYRAVVKRLCPDAYRCCDANPDVDYTLASDVKVDFLFVLAVLTAASVSVSWYLYSQESWVWVLQDVMGVSVCVMFLSAVRLPNLRVAATLLSLAFL